MSAPAKEISFRSGSNWRKRRHDEQFVTSLVDQSDCRCSKLYTCISYKESGIVLAVESATKRLGAHQEKSSANLLAS